MFSGDLTFFYKFPCVFMYIWAFGQLFAAIWAFMKKHILVGLILSLSCFFSFLFPEFLLSRQEVADFVIDSKTITIESHRITSPDGGCTYVIYEPIIKGFVAERKYSFFASLPNLPFSKFVTTEENETGYSIIFNDNSRRLIVSYDYATDEWSETNEETE